MTPRPTPATARACPPPWSPTAGASSSRAERGGRARPGRRVGGARGRGGPPPPRRPRVPRRGDGPALARRARVRAAPRAAPGLRDDPDGGGGGSIGLGPSSYRPGPLRLGPCWGVATPAPAPPAEAARATETPARTRG